MSHNKDGMHYVRQILIEDLLKKGVPPGPALEAMSWVPRHLFVSEALRFSAYHDISLPIGFGQTISKPSIIARMVHSLSLNGNERVLEIGTGSGYQSAILAELTSSLVTMERIKELSFRSRDVLSSLGYSNIQHIHSDDFNRASGYYDAIIVAAGIDILPLDLFTKLNDGGILIIPIGNSSGHYIKRYMKKNDRDIYEENIGEATFVPLIIGDCV